MAGSVPVWTIEPDFRKLQAELDKVAAREAAVTAAAEKLGVSQKEAAKAMSTVEKAAQRVQDQLARGREADFAIRMDTATEAVKAANGGLNDFKTKVNLSAEALGKASAAAGALGPEFTGIAAGAQKAVGALGGVASAMQVVGGPVGIALGAALATLTLAWGKHEEQTKKNEEALKGAKEEAEKTSSVFNKLAKDLFEATLQQQVLNKEITQAEADIQRAAHGINEAYGPALEGAVNKMDELKAKLAEQQKIIDEAGKSLENFGGMGSNAGKKIANAKAEQERLNEELGRAEDAYDRLQASMNNLGAVQTDNITKTADQKNATKAAKDATKDAADTERELAELADLRAKNTEANYEVWLRDAQAEADARKLAYEATKAAEEAKRAEFAKTLALAEENRKRAEEARQQDLEAVQEYTAQVGEIASGAGDIAGLIYEKRVANTEDLYDRYEQALEDGDEATAKSLKKQYEAEKEGALKAFKVNKALAITTATLSSVVAVAKALEAGWPAALLTVPAAAAAGAAQIAAAAMQEPPEFDDTPQVMRAVSAGDDGRVPISAKRNDLVAMAQTPDGLRSQIDRLDGGGGSRREILAERMNRTLAGRTVTRDLRAVTRGIWRSA